MTPAHQSGLFVVSGFYGCADLMEKRGGREKVGAGRCIENDLVNRTQKEPHDFAQLFHSFKLLLFFFCSFF